MRLCHFNFLLKNFLNQNYFICTHNSILHTRDLKQYNPFLNTTTAWLFGIVKLVFTVTTFAIVIHFIIFLHILTPLFIVCGNPLAVR